MKRVRETQGQRKSHRPRKAGASINWKRRGNGSPRASFRNAAWLTPGVNPVRPTSDLWSTQMQEQRSSCLKSLMAEREGELESLLMRVKKESEKAGNIQKKLRSWYPVPSLHGKQKWKKWKQWQILFSWTPKSLWMVTAAMKLKNTCSLGKKSYGTPRQRIKNQRHPFADTDGCESWTINKVEHQRIDAFELWCWRRLLRVPQAARR